ncbi:hypothetical protein P691DRAFT_737086 [Macrolepiota fuliginosa MF-IS2]|uniref:G domain-containing protein n=1 Tax=Macrolepiota fuliginosa MF-IS2 TaxID=1400762 RepID=A0A9P5X4T3_9AGAR|nr:hypothetical protein P691DRAFT_737086 [Macrolepiota fuliginosa MF-IS2]
MGPTGAGKSTFIQTMIGRETNGVGHSLESYTNQISAMRVTFSDGVSVVLVDTPGFDDTHLSDLDILKIVAKWLEDIRRRSLTLSGILYLHRISDNRMAGTPLKNLKMFKKLCGEDFFEKVILTTTMWPEVGGGVEEDIYIRREGELSRTYWAEMTNKGSFTCRFRNTQASAWEILNRVVAHESRRRLIRIQEELVDQKKSLPTTEAGQQLHGIFEALIEKQNDLLNRTKEELGRTGDPEVLMTLLSEMGELRKERDKAVKDMRQLNSSPLGKWRSVSSSIRRVRRRKT